MAKKGKAKISKVKRNNQTTNKMKKQGKLKLQRHRTSLQKHSQPDKPQTEYSSGSDSASGDEWADMLDEDEQQYIMSRLAKQPQLLANVPETEQETTQSSKKRKRDRQRSTKIASDSGAESDASIEDKYEKDMSERPVKKLRALLPIKTKQGLMERAEEVEDTDSDEDRNAEPTPVVSTTPDHSDSDSGVGGAGEEGEAPEGGVVGAVELLAARRDRLQHDKLRIGALCSSLLESPEKKMKNLYPILYLMEERLKDETLNLLSIRKYATLSACEVFRDILPEYQIRHQDYSNIKLKKDTLSLYKYEKELLEFYKRYLQRLEKAATVLRRKKGDTRKLEDATISLALVSLRCMCNMLVAKPNFNYATNIAQSVVPFLDCKEDGARAAATECCTQVFADDRRGDITLTIVRLINQLVKRRGDRLRPSSLDCLLTLKIRDVDMNEAADVQHKKKQEEKHKKRIVNLSKKEKKRAKKLKEVERELLETEAQESELSRRKQLTEVTRTVFHIYFRLLKTAPRSKLLAAALSGLAKFTHVINLEYYSDLVAILGRLVDDELVAPRERLLCVRTVLAILAGAGDALQVDPAKFHAHLYASALNTHAGSTHADAKIILEAVTQICARARRVSPAVLQAFAKRLTTLAVQLSHNGALASLALVHQLAQQSKAVASLFEPDAESGSGRFDATLPSPEHCNAHAAALRELCALRTHYHATVRSVATAMLAQRPPHDLAKLTPSQIFDQYDGAQMGFKPAITPPKRDQVRSSAHGHTHTWTQKSLKELCESVEGGVQMIVGNEMLLNAK